MGQYPLNIIDMIYVGLEEANKTTLKCVLIAYQACVFIQLFLIIHVSRDNIEHRALKYLLKKDIIDKKKF